MPQIPAKIILETTKFCYLGFSYLAEWSREWSITWSLQRGLGKRRSWRLERDRPGNKVNWLKSWGKCSGFCGSGFNKNNRRIKRKVFRIQTWTTMTTNCETTWANMTSVAVTPATQERSNRPEAFKESFKKSGTIRSFRAKPGTFFPFDDKRQGRQSHRHEVGDTQDDSRRHELGERRVVGAVNGFLKSEIFGWYLKT